MWIYTTEKSMDFDMNVDDEPWLRFGDGWAQLCRKLLVSN